MAKKVRILGVTDGQSEKNIDRKAKVAQANLDSLPLRLKQDLEATGKDLHKYLQDALGINSSVKEVEWKLQSGVKTKFLEVQLTYEQVRDDTVVDFDVNGRDQEFLTSGSVSDLETMCDQQFYPAIANRVGDKISILDGSRRRAFFLLQKGNINHFTVLISQSTITTEDAKALAKSLQTAKEHNLYELGKRCYAYKAKGFNKQEDIAKALGISRTKVVRAMQAADIDGRVLKLFFDINELTVKEYAELNKINDHLRKIECGYDAISEIDKGSIEDVLSKLRALVSTHKEDKAKVKTIQLVKFDDKNKHARKKLKNRSVNYEFGRLTEKEQVHIDKAIEGAIRELFGELDGL